MSRPRALCALLSAALATFVVLSCGTPQESATSAPAAIAVPEPDLTAMEPQVEQRLRATRTAVLETPQSAAAWGEFGRVAHAHELWEEATVAYRRAQQLDPDDVRWPYFLGDVLSVVGTDLEAAANAFRRALELRPDYAPAHMRLGKVLLAADQPQAAAGELQRAIELEPDLQPARVALAQIRLSENQLDRSQAMLEALLEQQPRHAQALSTLGQVYMRQGKRDLARATAARARDAAVYNLFADPLMTEVVAEGLSSILIWERAKAFLDNGNYQQAALGLAQVVKLKPQNVDAHQQLAVAYGNLGETERSRHHLERVVALEPDRVEALVQLATVQIDQQQPEAAIGPLQRVLELAPADPDARWLLGRAQVLSGNLAGGLESFAAAQAVSGDVPLWARNDWGSALAQSGQPEAALEQFRATLADNPRDAQAMFYIGLVLEGLGRAAEAAEQYCRSMHAQPNPPAQSRLQALGHRCG